MGALVNTKCDYRNMRIALTEPLLAKGWFFTRKISTPDTVQYKNFSGVFSQSYGGQVQHGFKNVSILWQNVDHYTAYKIKDYVDQTIANSGYLYLTVPYNDGTKLGGTRWIDVRVVPYPLDLEEIQSFAGGQGIAYANLTLFGNNLTIINDPATGI